VKLEVDEAGMGDHCNLPDYRKILQPRRLHEQIQSLEQLDEVIKMIRKLMLKSAGTVSKEKLSRRKEVATTTQKKQGDGADE
jgi:hypothetical protein